MEGEVFARLVLYDRSAYVVTSFPEVIRRRVVIERTTSSTALTKGAKAALVCKELQFIGVEQRSFGHIRAAISEIRRVQHQLVTSYQYLNGGSGAIAEAVRLKPNRVRLNDCGGAIWSTPM